MVQSLRPKKPNVLLIVLIAVGIILLLGGGSWYLNNARQLVALETRIEAQIQNVQIELSRGYSTLKTANVVVKDGEKVFLEAVSKNAAARTNPNAMVTAIQEANLTVPGVSREKLLEEVVVVFSRFAEQQRVLVADVQALKLFVRGPITGIFFDTSLNLNSPDLKPILESGSQEAVQNRTIDTDKMLGN
jgi:hypothetical protein